MAQTGGGYCQPNPSIQATYDFMLDIMRDQKEIFQASMIHLGGDEVYPSCYTNNPEVWAWMQANNMTSGYDACWYYERKLADIARSLNLTMIGWDDIQGPAAPANYTDLILEVWDNQWQTYLYQYAQSGWNVTLSTPFYIVQGSQNTWTYMYSMDVFNCSGSCTWDAATKARVLGAELCAWDDAMLSDPGDLLVDLSPFIQGVGEAWWSPEAVSAGNQPDMNRAHIQRCRQIARGIPGHPIYGFSSFCPFEFIQPQTFA